MKVIRVTSNRGWGMYTSGAARKAGLALGSSVTRPFPSDDGILQVDNHHRFGFKSVQQLRSWFYGELDTLREANNLQVRIYEVPDKHVGLGFSQVVYHHKRAKLLEIKQLKEIL